MVSGSIAAEKRNRKIVFPTETAKKEWQPLSKKVIRPPPRRRRHGPRLARNGGEDVELGIEILAEVHDAGHVAAAIAVVGRAPDRHHALVLEVPLEAFLHELVRARNQLQIVDMVEFGRDLVAKEPARTARTDGPRFHLFGIAPDQVAKGALVRDLLGARDDADLVQGADLGREAAVHAEDFAVDDGGQGQEVEDLAGGFPDGGVAVLLLTFFVEAVDLGDLAGLVVAADEGDAVGITRRE